ncbi:hypothetical protein ACQKL5_10950 [Peribacillus sp. NPDC097675]|uniref:hypothetical protein n=1 Tax=Peribacillus sp. NPDC097675 TaxID=3390618 RepID=UPI003D03A05C
MEAFQRKLNHNRDEYRRNMWAKHREQVTELFNTALSKQASVDKIGIIGAGNCDDLDLDHLATKCNLIYLFDIDKESMINGIKNFSESTQCKIQLVECDVSGLEKVNFEQILTSMLMNGERTENIVEFLKKTNGQLSEIIHNEFAEYIGSFDIFATSAIYTQLFYNWALDTLENNNHHYEQMDLIRIKDGFLDVRDQIVLNLQELSFKCCTPKGFYITWSDILQMKPEYIQTINQGINAIFSLASNVGYGAALLAIQDYMGKVNRREFSLRHWVWDFHEDKQYLTIGLVGKKEQCN